MYEEILTDLENKIMAGTGLVNRRTGVPEYLGHIQECCCGTVGVYPVISRATKLVTGFTYALNKNKLSKRELLQILNGGEMANNAAYAAFYKKLRIKKQKRRDDWEKKITNREF